VPTDEERTVLKRVRQIGNHHFADLAASGAVQNKAEGAFGVMLADQDNGLLKKGTSQLPAVQEQLASEVFRLLRHGCLAANVHHACRIDNPDYI
jgi:hypothetical protein